jgi:hypothetical protein
MASSGQMIDDDRISRISVASNAVAAIPKSDLTETKSYAKPPQPVKDVLEAVMILLGYKGTELVIYIKDNNFNVFNHVNLCLLC